jgi:hypothetical protein
MNVYGLYGSPGEVHTRSGFTVQDFLALSNDFYFHSSRYKRQQSVPIANRSHQYSGSLTDLTQLRCLHSWRCVGRVEPDIDV